jgi:hypothetical protein
MIALRGCSERVIVKGHLPFQDETSRNRFVDQGRRRPRTDFLPFREGQAEVQLFQAILRGDHLLHGFRKAGIRRLLKGAAKDPTVRRRHAVAGGRLLKRLHIRGFLANVPPSRRWRVTAAGQRLLAAVVRRYQDGLATAA